MHGERSCLLLVEGTQSGKILRARLLQLDVVAHHANNIRLLLYRLREIDRAGHGSLLFSVKQLVVGRSFSSIGSEKYASLWKTRLELPCSMGCFCPSSPFVLSLWFSIMGLEKHCGATPLPNPIRFSRLPQTIRATLSHKPVQRPSPASHSRTQFFNLSRALISASK